MKLWALVLGLVLGVGAGAYRWRTPPYPKVRAGFVRTQLAIAQPAETLVLGDSISESTWLENVCGSTVNASIGGASVQTIAEVAPFALRRIRPRIVVLEIGTNHFWRDKTPTAAFKSDYVSLVRSLPGKRILVGIPNSAEGNAFVEQVARLTGSAFVPPVTGPLTIDGAHPTPEGALTYRGRIAAACSGDNRNRPA